MAKATLSTNFIDDILHESAGGKRKYRMVYNDDGTVSFDDVTVYEQEGSDYGAGDINRTNEAVNQSFDKNKLIRDMDAINAITQDGYAPDALALKEVNNSVTFPDGTIFYPDIQDGKYGFNISPNRGADTFRPFSRGLENTVTRHYSTYINIYDYGGQENKPVGSYTASKDGKVIVSFLGVQYKVTGTGNATTNQKLYRNGSLISSSNYCAVLDLKAGETISSTITLYFAKSSSKDYYGFYTGFMVITEMA